MWRDPGGSDGFLPWLQPDMAAFLGGRRWREGYVSGEDNRLSCTYRVSVCCLVSNDQALKRQIKQKEAITSTAHLSKTQRREKLIISTPAEI